MIHIPHVLNGDAVFALLCAAGILAPFFLEMFKTAPPSRQARAKLADDPATLALVARLKSKP